MPEDNTINIGGKPFMNYVTAVVMQVNRGAKGIIVKARGRFISRAVDVVEVTTRKFLKELSVKEIKLGSEEFENKEKKKVNVSTIEIRLGK